MNADQKLSLPGKLILFILGVISAFLAFAVIIPMFFICYPSTGFLGMCL